MIPSALQCWVLGTCCSNRTKFTLTSFLCFPQIALHGSCRGRGVAVGAQGDPGRQQRQSLDKSCQEVSAGVTQSLADFRGQVSLPSKFPSPKGPAECLWVNFSLLCRVLRDSSSGLHRPISAAPHSATGWLHIPTSVPLFSVPHALSKRGLPAPTGLLFRDSRFPPSLPLKCRISHCLHSVISFKYIYRTNMQQMTFLFPSLLPCLISFLLSFFQFLQPGY